MRAELARVELEDAEVELTYALADSHGLDIGEGRTR